MKNLFVFGAMLFSLSMFGQWNIASYHSNAQEKIHAIDEDHLIRTGTFDQFYYSDNGGILWQEINTDFQYSFISDLQFLDEEIGYACGGTYFGLYFGCLAKTIDGGQSWDTISSNQQPWAMLYTQMHFVNEDIGFFATDNQGMVKTTDGGLSYESIDLPSFFFYNSITDIEFINEDVGFITRFEFNNAGEGTHRYSILKTIDQGETWSEVFYEEMDDATLYTKRDLIKLAIGDEDHIYASGSNGAFARSFDGGDTWESMTIPPSNSYLTSLEFTSALEGYTNVGGVMHKTTDGGENWTLQAVFPAAIVNDISMVDSNVGFFISTSATYKTSNGGEVLSVLDMDMNEIQVFPNPSSEYIQILNDSPVVYDFIELYDMKGRWVKSFSPQDSRLNIQEISSGSYVLFLKKEDEYFRSKIQIQ